MLESLILADNSLAELPEAIGALTRLRTLDLGHNHLADLPESLGRLTGLTDYLYLHDNRLSALRESLFARLIHLRYLNVSGNQLTHDLRWVRLTSIPPAVAILEDRGCRVLL